jgi:hypothetical protein
MNVQPFAQAMFMWKHALIKTQVRSFLFNLKTT